ncbi:conserved protein, unknown function [Plasmodium yoelii]|uniref:Uncharacterized protein n=3 Tax=Plasmodium yoelii TaxID=5861 RepID=A0AAF0B869_PLAYO|nr:conserved protein, unknown function [Plasmodium yoelii]WBY60150.1 hypothetical protein Py17XNL_001303289 [Plasmodium yoelii yoelii]CDU20055.1 conserved Plasmodium protein, unknown function [Plasmodium yoelii]VTZ80813.1 conserved protein, unknown function [Plasmodium yoelii]|eukprot:XP_728185.2 conserved protein, unknown function [Plasmodium yoelii]
MKYEILFILCNLFLYFQKGWGMYLNNNSFLNKKKIVSLFDYGNSIKKNEDNNLIQKRYILGLINSYKGIDGNSKNEKKLSKKKNRLFFLQNNIDSVNRGKTNGSLFYQNNKEIKKMNKNRKIGNNNNNKNVLYAENYKINLTEKPIIEQVPRNVKGRINEWIPEFEENNTLGFFPILLEEMSNEPSPLQIGFEDYMQFNGENVEEIFKNMTREVKINNEPKKIFGMCFFNHKTGALAPLAVYAEIKDVTKVGNNLAVKGLVRGRVIIDEIINQEPCILGKILPIEDKKGLVDTEESLKIVDEIIRIHGQCTTMESHLMEQLDQSFASMNIKLRNDLKESIDAKLEKFQIDPSDVEQKQAFIQIASFAAFDFHLMIVDRYDALMLQNSEDRLRLVRDKIRQKQKQLAIIKNTPKEKLQEILEQVQNIKNQNIPPPNFPKP